MFVLRVTSRQALGELWLPWCVDRQRPHAIVRVDHEPPERCAQAMQLRVKQITDPAFRDSLRRNGDAGQVDTTEKVEQLSGVFQSAARLGRVELAAGLPLPQGDWPMAFWLPEGPMFCEACHRACALYASGVEPFELRVLVMPLRWPEYECPALRSSSAAT